MFIQLNQKNILSSNSEEKKDVFFKIPTAAYHLGPIRQKHPRAPSFKE